MAARRLSNAAAGCSNPLSRMHIARTLHTARCCASIRELQADLASGATSVSTVVDRYLQTIKDTQHLGSFLHIAEDSARQQVRMQLCAQRAHTVCVCVRVLNSSMRTHHSMLVSRSLGVLFHAQAHALDDIIAKQGMEAAGPLAGVPIAIKVCVCVGGGIKLCVYIYICTCAHSIAQLQHVIAHQFLTISYTPIPTHSHPFPHPPSPHPAPSTPPHTGQLVYNGPPHHGCLSSVEKLPTPL